MLYPYSCSWHHGGLMVYYQLPQKHVKQCDKNFAIKAIVILYHFVYAHRNYPWAIIIYVVNNVIAPTYDCELCLSEHSYVRTTEKSTFYILCFIYYYKPCTISTHIHNHDSTCYPANPHIASGVHGCVGGSGCLWVVLGVSWVSHNTMTSQRYEIINPSARDIFSYTQSHGIDRTTPHATFPYTWTIRIFAQEKEIDRAFEPQMLAHHHLHIAQT